MRKSLIYLCLIFTLLISCSNDNEEPENNLKTENIVVIIMDGPRYSETWDNQQFKMQSHLFNDIAPQGVFFEEFYNNGETYTVPGHTAIATGNYQKITNNGSELPINPSFMQYWLEATGLDSTKAWVITSKDKLEVISDCLNPKYRGKFRPATNCGIGGGGIGSGYRHDSLTFQAIEDVVSNYTPNLVFINLREPDYTAHKGDWQGYLDGIYMSDNYIYKIWNMFESKTKYQNKTSYFITNDHGRHLDSIANGFIAHGDGCLGCRHISLLALGPDFKKNVFVNNKREMIDITTTIGYLLGINIPTSQGKLIEELF